MSAPVVKPAHGRQVRFYHPLVPWAFLVPACVLLAVFALAPIAQVVYYSFTRYTAFSGPDPVGWENYTRLFASDRFWFTLRNSFIYLLVTPAVILLSLLAALVVHSGIRGNKLLRVLLLLPVITPGIVASMSFRLLLDEDAGLINRSLSAVGLPTVGWLTTYPFTLISAMLVTLWRGFGYYMMIFLAGLLSVPRELEEAAGIDGAGRWGVLRHVTLPGIAPVIALVFLVSSISAMKVFDELYVTLAGAPITHQTVVPLLYRVMSDDGDYGLSSAMGVVLFLIILCFTVVQLRLQRGREGR
jgi:putative chitobiose transport system permease protein